ILFGKLLESVRVVKTGCDELSMTPRQWRHGEGLSRFWMELFRKYAAGKRAASCPEQQLQSRGKVSFRLGMRNIPLRGPECADEPGIARNILYVIPAAKIVIVLITSDASNIRLNPEPRNHLAHGALYPFVACIEFSECEEREKTAVHRHVQLEAGAV